MEVGTSIHGAGHPQMPGRPMGQGQAGGRGYWRGEPLKPLLPSKNESQVDVVRTHMQMTFKQRISPLPSLLESIRPWIKTANLGMPFVALYPVP